MHVLHLTEGSAEWLAWRREGLGGSDAPAVFGLSRHLSALALWEEKCGAATRHEDTLTLARGRNLEPIARERYRDLVGDEVPPLCCTHEEHGFVRASLDGYAAARGLPVELKAPRRTDHRQALEGRVPSHYLPQCLHILLATGAERMHYVSYHPGGFRTRDQLAIVAVARDEHLVADLLLAERSFWRSVLDRSPPPRPPFMQWSHINTESVRHRP